MDDLCRICLKVPNKEMCRLQEYNTILQKIELCLSIHISINESLPNQLCKECTNKIEEIFDFCSKVKENEEKLQQCLTNCTFRDYYLKLINDKPIKIEKSTSIIFPDNVKKEKCDDFRLTREETDTDGKIINDKVASKDFSKSDSIKLEESMNNDFNENTCYSTDDEITLNNVKNGKAIDANTLSKTSKRINKKSAQKNLKKNYNFQETANETQFTCLTCMKPYDTQMNLIKHYNEEHYSKYKDNIKSMYTENECDSIITYKCTSCDEFYNKKKDIIKHVATHNQERPLICKLCGRMYKTVTEIVRHSRVHSGVKLQCSYNCGYSTAYQGALKEHENRHRDVYKYTCEKCGKGFHVRTWFEQHQNIHNGLKPFICDICGLAFHMDRYLTAHRSSMHPQCSSVKRYICVYCDQPCDSANSLALHLEEHGINKAKDFLCDFCGKILASADQLKYHHRMHSGVKPYSCSICNKSFAKKFNMKIHMSSHTGEKTHACGRCGKRYTQRSTMLRHLKRHHTGSSSPKRTG